MPYGEMLERNPRRTTNVSCDSRNYTWHYEVSLVFLRKKIQIFFFDKASLSKTENDVRFKKKSCNIAEATVKI